ncbi:MAG: serine hydrolase [Ignavibacterium sp.]|jgi:CubicO group peptidase (beta-lactamase class C family)|nr:serine hydrolase [Ignavibacterium sp.]
MKKFFLLICISFFSTSILFSQTTPKFVTDSLDNYVLRGMNNWQIPGIAVLIVKDGKIVVSKAYGVKELGKNELVDENTLFLIGSNTKAFTGTALALLEQEGKLKLDDKVITYLPDFKMKDPWITKDLTLTDIVTHRMGYETFQGDFMFWASDLTADEVIEKLGSTTPKYDFRTKYGYTNAGYAIAGKVIKKVSGLSWSDFLKEKIFSPLKMNRTVALSVDFSKSDNVAKPHTMSNDQITVLPFEYIDNMAPCGSIGSSVSDLSHWLIAQLDSGRFDGETKIPFEVIKRTRKPETIIGRARRLYNEGHFNLYGLGWALTDYEGTEIVSHTGAVNGFLSSVTLLPEENLGIAVLTNSDANSLFEMLKWEIIDSYLGLPYRNYDEIGFKRSSAREKQTSGMITQWQDSVKLNIKPQIPLSDFAGKYKHDVYGFAELELNGNSLLLKLEHHSKLTAKLEYIGSNRFLCTYSNPTYGIKVFPFEIENGKIKSFTLFVTEGLDFQPYKFVKQ